MARPRIRSLRRRTLAELLGRARQAVNRALEVRGIGDIGEPTGDDLSVMVDLDGFDQLPVIRGPFFASLDDRAATLEALRRVDDAFEARLRARADRIVEGHHDLLGFTGLSFGHPPDWWLDPVAGVRAPARHWSRIDFLDPAVVGDHKVVWELARHQGLVTLAQAWWCTRDDGYRRALGTLLESWLEANPPKTGPHWVSSLELSFRGIAWLWILALAADALPPVLRRRMVGHLAVSARHVERYLSTWFSPNTHLTGEAVGLFMLGTALPQCRDATRWRAIGARTLLEWVGRHVRADGTYVEQSSWYHRYTTDFYLQFMVLADRAGMPVREQVAGPLAGLLDVLRWIARPDGSMPLIGDDDGGRFLFLDERTGHDVRTPLALGAVLLGRGDFAAAAGTPSPEVVWLLGPDGLARFTRLEPVKPTTRRAAFPDGGVYVMRSGWDGEAAVMTIDAGPHGFMNGGHAHADALTLDLCLEGRPVFVDPGTFTYSTHPEWRDRFRETASHCGAVVDGCGSAVPAGPFQWATRATARCLAWHDAGTVALFAGTHDGFARMRPAVRYRRIVAFVEPDLWIVRDELDSEGDHELAVHWQCAAGVDVTTDADDLVLRADAGRIAARVAERGGEWSVSDGWVSPVYGARIRAPHLRFIRRATGPMAVTTVVTTGAANVTAAASGSSPGIAPIDVTWSGRRGLLATRAGLPGWLDTDAEVAWLDFRSSTGPRLTVVGATRLVVNGSAIALDGRPAMTCEVDPGGAWP
jgi:hypothetical protein